jgi:hypothetical protein
MAFAVVEFLPSSELHGEVLLGIKLSRKSGDNFKLNALEITNNAHQVLCCTNFGVL